MLLRADLDRIAGRERKHHEEVHGTQGVGGHRSRRLDEGVAVVVPEIGDRHQVGEEVERASLRDDPPPVVLGRQATGGDAQLGGEHRRPWSVPGLVDELERVGEHGEFRMAEDEIRDQRALAAGVGARHDDAHERETTGVDAAAARGRPGPAPGDASAEKGERRTRDGPYSGPMREKDLDVEGVPQAVATGALPAAERIDELVAAAHARALGHGEGAVADYIPILADADPEAFGVCVADVGGGLHEVGDTRTPFSIQSISKAFVYALLCEHLGHEAVHEIVGVNNTGLPFNSVVAIELNDGHPMNPMVNAGALATTALLPGATAGEKWGVLHAGLSRFAGRELVLDEEVFRSESETNHRNRAIAQLLESYGRIRSDPADVVDVYTRQCALLVDARDLSVMGATLADGGVNPLTGERVVSATVCRDTLAVLAASGLYERSGEWLFEVGIPGKSGVAGGLVTVAPGKAGIGAYAPRLDSAGNSVRGQIATAYLSRALGLNIFASDPHRTGGDPA